MGWILFTLAVGGFLLTSFFAYRDNELGAMLAGIIWIGSFLTLLILSILEA